VSRTTASDAINGSGRLDGATRERVLDAARRLGYRANVHARMLRRGHSGLLAVANSLPGELRDQVGGIEYYAQVQAGAAAAAMTAGYALVLLTVEPDSDEVERMFADGALLLDPTTGSPLAERLEAQGVPLVSTGRRPDRPPESGRWVDNDLYAATRMVLDLFERRGARRPALLADRPVRSYTIDAIRAYEDWTAERGIEPRTATAAPPASESAGYHAAEQLLGAPTPPDALYAPLDRLASGALLAARNRGLRVPGDVMIAAGSESALTREAKPPITALELYPSRIGELAIELLIERVEDPGAPDRHVVVDAEVIERLTC
jgi:DNA-binding LacI/PurR family transcriptional regulator